MKQRDIERVMAAAWEAVDARDPNSVRTTRALLHMVLTEVDPNGAYRAYGSLAYRAGGTADEPYVSLRNSPRLLRADEAGGHE